MKEHPVDTIIEPLGLPVVKTGSTVRRYQGTVDGRRIQVQYQRIYRSQTRPRVYVRSSIKIYVDAPLLKTRVRIGPAKAVMSKLKQVETPDPAYEGRFIFGLDPAWTELLVSDSHTKPLIERLTERSPTSSAGSAVFIQPESVLWMGSIHETALTEDYMRQQIDDLAALAGAAEALPATYTPVKASASEKAALEGKFPLVGLVVVALFFAAAFAVLFICVLLAAFLSGGGF